MNRLNSKDRARIVKCLCEGMSIRSTARICECAINTVVKLLTEVGPACQSWHSANVVNLNTLVAQMDEIWALVGSKEKNTTVDKKAEGNGDCWTWTALDADSKLMITWAVGKRDAQTCEDFVTDLAERTPNHPQVSSDGLAVYKRAMLLAYGPDVDYGMVIKHYGQEIGGEKRYSPAVCTGCETKAVIGNPIESQISTSYVEGQNLNIRMGCRRFTRLTNAFSKKVGNHEAAISLYFMFYNFCRPHQTLTNKLPSGKRVPTTPAMAASLTDECWTIERMLETVWERPNQTDTLPARGGKG